MARRKNSESREEEEDFLPVVYARSADEAQEYQQLLEDHDIPVKIGDEDDESQSGKDKKKRAVGIPLMVPEDRLDEASDIIANQEEEVEDEDEDFDDDEDEDQEVGQELTEEDDPVGEEGEFEFDEEGMGDLGDDLSDAEFDDEDDADDDDDMDFDSEEEGESEESDDDSDSPSGRRRKGRGGDDDSEEPLDDEDM